MYVYIKYVNVYIYMHRERFDMYVKIDLIGK